MSRESGNGDVLSSRVLEEAATWFVNLADASTDEADRKRWQAWMGADPDHARAWNRIEELTQQFTPFARMGKVARHVLDAPRRRGRRNVLKVLGVLLVAGVGGSTALRMPWRDWRQDLAARSAAYRTAIGEILPLVLADGTRVWLGSRSAMDAAYTAASRRLALYEGDLLVETAHDIASPARPFIVDTRHASLLALGTRFAVRSGAGESRLDVFEGSVQITLSGEAHATHVLQAGEHAVFDRLAFKAIGRADPSRAAWARGILLADGMRLDELVIELGRWHSQPLSCAPEIGGLEVVGALPLKDLDRILARLQDSFPVRVVRDGDGVRIVAATASSPLPAGVSQHRE